MAKKIHTHFEETIRWIRICKDWQDSIRTFERQGRGERAATDCTYKRLSRIYPELSRSNWNKIRTRCDIRKSVKPYRWRKTSPPDEDEC